jgi:hypothetical protein
MDAGVVGIFHSLIQQAPLSRRQRMNGRQSIYRIRHRAAMQLGTQARQGGTGYACVAPGKAACADRSARALSQRRCPVLVPACVLEGWRPLFVKDAYPIYITKCCCVVLVRVCVCIFVMVGLLSAAGRGAALLYTRTHVRESSLPVDAAAGS